MITYDPQELEKIIKIVSSSSNTDAMPAYSWARAAKVLLAEVERLRKALSATEDALLWCGGSNDFAPGGKAHEGWMKLARPALELAHRALEGKEVEE